MRLLLRLARLAYPRAWRERYGAEFAALLEDSGSDWMVLADVLFGGIKMRIVKTDFRLCLGLGLAGLVIAGLVSLRVPSTYRSEAIVRVSAAGATQEVLRDAVLRAEGEALSRTSLSNLIQHPLLNLYQRDRERLPLEDVIEQMKRRDIRVLIEDRPGNPSQIAVTVGYAGLSPELAKQTTQLLLSRFIDANVHNMTGNPVTIDVLDPASLPVHPNSPNRLMICLAGLGIGLGLGILIAGFRHWTRVMLMGIAGALLAAGVSFAIPDRYVSDAVLEVRNTDIANQLTGKVLGDHDKVMDILRAAGAGATLQDLQIQWNSPELGIRMVSKDRFGAQRAVQKTIVSLIDASREPSGATGPERAIEVVDPPSFPAWPASPNRLLIAGVGLLAGLLAGIAMRVFRRNPAETPEPA